MRLRTRPVRALLVAATSAVFCVTAFAVTTFLTVSPTNLQGWQIHRSSSGVTPTPTPTPDVLFVTGPATPPLGTGSAEFRMGPDGGGAAQLRHPGYAGTRLPNPLVAVPPAANELSGFSYSTYVQQDIPGGHAPYIILQIDTDGDAGIEDLLFFEPVYQSATFCPSNPQPALVTGQWQTWDALNGCWYSVFGTAGSGPGTNTRTLRQLSAALPTGVIANSSPSGLGGVRLVTGFGAVAWDNFIGNADALRIGVGANDTLYNFDPTQSSPVAGALLISEFRTRGPAGAEDEFIELYNNTNSDHVVTPPDGSGGYTVATSDGQVRCTIPFGTVLSARGHFLCVNNDGYSLASYPAGAATTATGDATYTIDIPDNAGLAFFSTANPANFNAGTRLDAVGSTSEANALYREGTGYPALGGTAFLAGIDHSFYRDNCGKSGSITTFGQCPSGGFPVDTNNNASDFIFVDTNGTSAGAGQRLGAPGPENSRSPIQRNSQFPASLIDPMAGDANAPNRARDTTSDPSNNSTFGTLTIRRTIQNNTGAPVTRLRFRIVDQTTFPASGDIADLRARSSTVQEIAITSSNPACPGNVCTVEGTTLEEPPTQPNGGAFNSTLTVNLASPIPDGAYINVQFRLGVQQTGRFKFWVNIEALTNDTPTPTVTAQAPPRKEAPPPSAVPSQSLPDPPVLPPSQGGWQYSSRPVPILIETKRKPKKRRALKKRVQQREKATPEKEGTSEEEGAKDPQARD